ncbi:DUF3624 family protein [Motilimonas pumila]|uniref:DUF3624 family protein n=1 Tax=Motilimonas pumila TaxID=2303987 RepID=A0A418YCZ6_9GAMM|nr:DUF3624 family protein [Motilimonas pumila]
MSCQQCGEWFLKKIGRCRSCMWQSVIIAFIGWFSWLWLDCQLTVEGITALFFAAAGSMLWLLHITFWCYWRWRDKGHLR